MKSSCNVYIDIFSSPSFSSHVTNYIDSFMCVRMFSASLSTTKLSHTVKTSLAVLYSGGTGPFAS